MIVFNIFSIQQAGRNSVRSEKPRNDGEAGDVDVALTVKLQQKLKETQMAKEKLEKKVDELEASLLKHKTQQTNVADSLKVCHIFNNNCKWKNKLPGQMVKNVLLTLLMPHLSNNWLGGRKFD